MRSSSVDMMYDGYDRSRKAWQDIHSRPLWKVVELVDTRNCYASCGDRRFYDAKVISMVPIYKWSRFEIDRMGSSEVVIDVDKGPCSLTGSRFELCANTLSLIQLALACGSTWHGI